MFVRLCECLCVYVSVRTYVRAREIGTSTTTSVHLVCHDHRSNYLHLHNHRHCVDSHTCTHLEKNTITQVRNTNLSADVTVDVERLNIVLRLRSHRSIARSLVPTRLLFLT